MSIERQAISALKWTGLARSLGQVGSWVITLLIVRLLAPEDYGLMAITSVIIGIFASVAELGVGAALVQAPKLDHRELERMAGVAIGLNLLIGLLVVLCAPLAALVFEEGRLIAVIRVLALQFVLNALCTVPQALASRAMNFKWLAWIDLASGLMSSISTLVLAYLGQGVWALVAGILAGSGLRAILLLAGGEMVRPVFRLDGITRHIQFGGALTASRLTWQAVSQADILIAGRLLTQEAVGFYAVAFHLATLPMQKIMSVVNQVAFPTVARLQGDLARLRERLLDASRLLAFVSVPAAWGLSAVAPELVKLAFGAKWEGVVFPLQVVSLVVPLRMISAFLITSVTALGRAAADLVNTLLTAVVLIPAFLVGAQWGVNGLAFAWLAATPVIFLLNFPRMRNALGIKASELVLAVWAPLAAGVAMYGAVAATRSVLHAFDDVLRLPALVLLGGVTYLGLVSLLDWRIWRDVKRTAAGLRDAK